MIITLDFLESLKKYKNSDTEEYLDNRWLYGSVIYNYIKENYPNGISCADLMEADLLTDKDLFFIKQYFDLDNDEIEVYLKRCKIDLTSKHIWRSNNIINCNTVFDSKQIIDSNFVDKSEIVKESEYVYSSVDITNSHEILHSVTVNQSNFISGSVEIESSSYVVDSTQIQWCENVLFSNNLESCGYIYQSNNLVECYFCGFCKNCNHCLFCSGLENASYQIFNKQVSVKEFERIYEILRSKIDMNTLELIEYGLDDGNVGLIQVINQDEIRANKRYKVHTRYDYVFNNLLPNFFGWVGTLEQYSEDSFISLFFFRND